MTKKLASLQFQRDIVRLGLEADVLGDLLYTLPADAHIVGFSEDLFTQTVNIVVQSDRFPEQVVGQELPSFTAKIEIDDDGNSYVETDIDEVFPRDFDMPTSDDVIGDEDKIRGMELTHCYIDEYPLIGDEVATAGALTVETLKEAKKKLEENGHRPYPQVDLSKYYRTQVDLYKDASIFGTGIVKIPEGTEIKAEYLETQCSHTWEQYTGLNETFEYCVHCDEKRNVRKG